MASPHAHKTERFNRIHHLYMKIILNVSLLLILQTACNYKYQICNERSIKESTIALLMKINAWSHKCKLFTTKRVQSQRGDSLAGSG